MWPTSLRGGGKTLVDGPLKRTFFAVSLRIFEIYVELRIHSKNSMEPHFRSSNEKNMLRFNLENTRQI